MSLKPVLPILGLLLLNACAGSSSPSPTTNSAPSPGVPQPVTSQPSRVPPATGAPSKTPTSSFGSSSPSLPDPTIPDSEPYAPSIPDEIPPVVVPAPVPVPAPAPSVPNVPPSPPIQAPPVIPPAPQPQPVTPAPPKPAQPPVVTPPVVVRPKAPPTSVRPPAVPAPVPRPAPRPLPTTQPVPPPLPMPLPPPNPPSGIVGTFVMGVNLSGLEANYDTSAGKQTGGYAFIALSALDIYRRSGLNLIRLPVLWERLQPRVGGRLDPIYIGEIKKLLERAGVNSQKIIIDVHNYGGRDGNHIGDGRLKTEDFTDLWIKLATEFKNQAAIAGFDLMNEPHDMPSNSAWSTAAQAAIDAIRTVDSKVTIYVEGDGWSSADTWSSQNPNFPLRDPSHKLIYSGHAYADRDSSGTHYRWVDEVAQGVTVDVLTTRISHFGEWCERQRVPCQIGEVGVGNDDPNWNIALEKALDYARDHKMQVTYWAAGPLWKNYAYAIESPSAPQLRVIRQYTK